MWWPLVKPVPLCCRTCRTCSTDCSCQNNTSLSTKQSINTAERSNEAYPDFTIPARQRKTPCSQGYNKLPAGSKDWGHAVYLLGLSHQYWRCPSNQKKKKVFHTLPTSIWLNIFVANLVDRFLWGWGNQKNEQRRSRPCKKSRTWFNRSQLWSMHTRCQVCCQALEGHTCC